MVADDHIFTHRVMTAAPGGKLEPGTVPAVCIVVKAEIPLDQAFFRGVDVDAVIAVVPRDIVLERALVHIAATDAVRVAGADDPHVLMGPVVPHDAGVSGTHLVLRSRRNMIAVERIVPGQESTRARIPQVTAIVRLAQPPEEQSRPTVLVGFAVFNNDILRPAHRTHTLSCSVCT
jgi:hypothetical protein